MEYSRLARILVLLVLVMVIVYPFIQGYLQRQATGEAMEDLPDLFQRAVLHYNVSTRELLSAVTGINASLQISDAINVSRKLASVSYQYPSIDDESILSMTTRAARSYSYMTNASVLFYRAAELNSRLYGNITGMLSLLGACRVDKALSIWYTVKGDVYLLLGMLEEGIQDSARVDPDSLLSESHRSIYAEGLERAFKLYGDVSRLIDLMNLVDAYREYLELKCSSQSSNLTATVPSGELVNGVNSLYNGIVGGRGGMYSYGLYSAITSIMGILSGDSQGGGIGQASRSPSSSPGRGAGYGRPPSDD